MLLKYYDSDNCKEQNKKWIIILVILIWSTFTLPWKYVGDRRNHTLWFTNIFPETVEKYGLSYAIKNYLFEPGWIIYNTFIYYLTKSKELFCYISAVISFGAVFYFFLHVRTKKLFKYNLALAFTMVPFYSIYLLRQMIAFSFTVIAFNFLMKRKFIQSITLVIIAFLFHKSSIIFSILILFKKLINEKMLCIISIMFIILPFTAYFGNKILSLLSINKWIFSGKLEYKFAYVKAALYFGIFIASFKNYQEIKIAEKNVLLMCIFLCGYFWLLTSFDYWVYRLNIYFMPGLMLILPYLKLRRNIYGVAGYISILFLIFVYLREMYLFSLFT